MNRSTKKKIQRRSQARSVGSGIGTIVLPFRKSQVGAWSGGCDFCEQRWFLGSRKIPEARWLPRAAASMFENVTFLFKYPGTEYEKVFSHPELVLYPE